MLKKENKKFFKKNNCDRNDDGIYSPTYILNNNTKKSQILHTIQNVNLPLEGRLWKKSMKNKNISIYGKSTNWTSMDIKHRTDWGYTSIYGIKEMYTFLEKFSNLKYVPTIDDSNISTKIITDALIDKVLSQHMIYYPNKDNSAIINNNLSFEKYVTRLNNKTNKFR
jgi:hypothetical protein